MVLACVSLATVSEAAWIWSPDIGKWINPKQAAKDTPEEQYAWALDFYNQKNWDRATEEFEKLVEAQKKEIQKRSKIKTRERLEMIGELVPDVDEKKKAA